MCEINLDNAILYANDSRGIYIPQYFAETIDRASLSNVAPDALDILLAGPDGEEYWEAWDEVVSRATVHDGPKGITYHLWQDGDLWLVPIDNGPDPDAQRDEEQGRDIHRQLYGE